MHDQINCKKEYYRLSSTCGAPRNHTNVQPVDAHVWRQLHLSAAARFRDSYCIFCFSDYVFLYSLFIIYHLLHMMSRCNMLLRSCRRFTRCTSWMHLTSYSYSPFYVLVPLFYCSVATINYSSTTLLAPVLISCFRPSLILPPALSLFPYRFFLHLCFLKARKLYCSMFSISCWNSCCVSFRANVSISYCFLPHLLFITLVCWLSILGGDL